jgi:hypothetical protein
MADDDETLLRDVQDWLHHNGYVLEMEVARQLLPHCSLVLQGSQYTDPVTGKLREIDVLCAWFRMREENEHRIDMIVECKSTPAPWVAFFGGSKAFQRDAGFPYSLVGEYGDCDVCDGLDDLYDLGPGNQVPIAYSITEKKTKGDKDLARDAVLAAASAAVSDSRENNKGSTEKSKVEGHRGHIILPVVVTRSPIFACSLDDSGQVNLCRIESCWVVAQHEMHDSSMRVLVMNYSGFGIYVSRLAETCRKLGFQ